MNRDSKLIIFVAVLASLLEIIDTSIVNVALPTMMGNLGATLEDISMVITGYAIANAIVLPASAWLSDRIGRRKYYLGCIILFTITSVACGLAPNLFFLTIFRILQGLVGGALLPTSQTLIYEQFPKEKAGMAGAIFGMSVMIGPTLGPVMGGYLTDNFGWRSIFNINLPLGLLALFVGLMVIRNPAHQQNKPNHEKIKLDTVGLTLLVLGIGCLQYVLERGESEDWFSSRLILINTLISIIALPAFVWWELKVENPIINIRLFKEAIVQSGVMLMSLLGFFLYGVVFLIPIFLGRAYHYDATQIGEMFIPGSLVTMAMMPFIGKMMQSGKNPKVLIIIGFLGLELCLYTMSGFSPLSSKSDVLLSLYIRGFALSFLFVPINSSILSQFTGQSLGQVAGLLNLFRQIGGSIGIAMVATLLNVKTHQNYLDLSSKVTAFNTNAYQFLNQSTSGMLTKLPNEIGFSMSHDAALKALYFKVQNQVFMMTYLQLISIMMITLLVAIVPLYRLKLQRGGIKVVDAH
ncbi:MAG: DHA2 family efflux MFS transporter permease subunit [Bdellovibrionaceae bacterium]|nr:DHA2 family efflux MFS transporter permease subunit [Pseudobdellovibrionaceae bacterium]NUM58169.1 DHA2 family efflux MFS transporter permease subunit [Pseudobdellovibrionaceae bacterium]